MARRSILFVLVSLLLAACATTAPRQTTSEDDSAVVYQEGVTTRYSVSMDELRSNATVHRQNRLPNAVVAGDQSLTVAASLFRSGDIFALDLIIQNHSDHRFEIDRTRFELFDNSGAHLVAKYDWPDGETYGLRSIQEFRRDYAHLGLDFEDSQPSRNSEVGGEDPAHSRVGTHIDATREVELAENPVNTDYSWISDLQFDEQTLVLPVVVELYPGKNRAYWGYWRVPAGDSGTKRRLEYPLTATIVIDGKRMLFRFEEPGATDIAR
jgi:hypothetical protein